MKKIDALLALVIIAVLIWGKNLLNRERPLDGADCLIAAALGVAWCVLLHARFPNRRAENMMILDRSIRELDQTLYGFSLDDAESYGRRGSFISEDSPENN